MYLYPYKKGSKGANELSKALGVKQVKLTNSKFKGSEDKLVINWGNSVISDEVSKCEVLNKPEAVALATNKLTFFQAIKAHNNKCRSTAELISIPRFCTSKYDAYNIIFDGNTVVARTVLNGHSGAGIVLCETIQQLEEVEAPLYVVYQPKKQEYRVHVLRGEVVDVQRKARDRAIPDDRVDWKIRNHDNGFIYARDELAQKVPKSVLDNSIKSVRVCGLDFGAVDVIYNEASEISYVLEVNTAPGLTGTTLEGYTKRFKELEGLFQKDKKEFQEWDIPPVLAPNMKKVNMQGARPIDIIFEEFLAGLGAEVIDAGR